MGLISQLIDPNMPAKLAQEAREALLCLNQQALQTLSKGGVRFFAGAPDSHKGGDYNPWTRKIQLTRPSKAEDLQHLQAYVLHEATHALDHIEGRHNLGAVERALTPAWDEFASRRDPKLAQLYQQYVQRSSADLAWHLGQRAQREEQPFEVQLPCRNYKVQLQGNAPQRLLMEDTQPMESLLASAGPSLTPAALGTSMGLVFTLAGLPLVGLPLLAAGLANAATCVRWIGEEQRLGDFESQGLVSESTRLQADLPLDKPKESMVTVYATTSRKVHEYFAEGMAEFLRSPDSRQRLLERDPELYAHCQSKGWHSG